MIKQVLLSHYWKTMLPPPPPPPPPPTHTHTHTHDQTSPLITLLKDNATPPPPHPPLHIDGIVQELTHLYNHCLDHRDRNARIYFDGIMISKHFLCYWPFVRGNEWPEQAAEQTVILSVIWDAMSPIWHHDNASLLKPVTNFTTPCQCLIKIHLKLYATPC